MKILKFEAENVKRLVAVEITPAGNMVVLTGDNGEGKSSILDAIYWTLRGTKNIQDVPIRIGQEKAYSRLDLGKYTVERRFTKKGTYLEVRTVEGAKFTDPQAVLNDLIGSIAFDPLEFARMKPADQYEAVRGIVDLGVDLDALRKAHDRDYQERTIINREVKNLEAAISQISVPEDAPTEPVDVVAKSQELMTMKLDEQNYTDAEKKLKDAKDLEYVFISDLAEARAALERAENTLQQQRAAIAGFEQNLANLHAKKPTPEAMEKVQQEINTANEKNRAYNNRARKQELEDKLKATVATADLLTEKLEGYKKQKDDAFAAAKWPVPGMSIQDGQVYYNGLPFDQASSAEQLRISAAIAMSGNSELRVMRIKDGSLLDKNGFKILEEMAKDHDYQVWVETVYTDDPLAIIIEDGTVKGAEPKTAAAE